MLRSLRSQLGAIVFGFVILIAGSAVITYVAAQARADDPTLRALLLIQLVFLAAALALLAWGYLFTRRRFARPLSDMNEAARRIAAGHLDAPVPTRGSDELATLARALESMRAEVAASRSQLESRVAQRTHELESVHAVSQEIVSQFDLGHLLRTVTDQARALTHAEATSLCLLDESDSTLVLSAVSGDGAAPTDMRQPIGLFPPDRVVGMGQLVSSETACATCGFLRTHAPGHCAAAPLRVGDHTLGALCVVRGNGQPFDSDETRALALLANSAAIAIANARLVEAERQQAEQAASLAERERLAAELHDHLAQTLSFLNLEIDRVAEVLGQGRVADAAAELPRMKQAIAAAYRQVRAALVGLHEPQPRDDLAAQLAACVAEFDQTPGLAADLVVADASALSLTRVAQTQAFLIVREALTNVRRHARASHARVRVERDGDQAVYAVQDDGRGFDASSAEGDHHLGLAIMHARAERSGGQLTVDSTPGGGTRIIARFPLPSPARGESDPGAAT